MTIHILQYVWECITIYHNLLQYFWTYFLLLLSIAIYYNMLQYTTIYYNILQYITIYYNILQYFTLFFIYYDKLPYLTIYIYIYQIICLYFVNVYFLLQYITMHGTILKYIEKMQYSMINVLRSAHVITFQGALGMRPGALAQIQAQDGQSRGPEPCPDSGPKLPK